MVNTKAIGQRIQEYRKKKGLTQENLAKRLNISTNYLSAIERGVQFPRFEILISIINAIGASADQIFVDVIDNTYEVRASILADNLRSLPPIEQKRILTVVETLVQNYSLKEK